MLVKGACRNKNHRCNNSVSVRSVKPRALDEECSGDSRRESSSSNSFIFRYLRKISNSDC